MECKKCPNKVQFPRLIEGIWYEEMIQGKRRAFSVEKCSITTLFVMPMRYLNTQEQFNVTVGDILK